MAKELKKSMSAAVKAGDLYYMKGNKKMLAVTKEMLDKWKKENKGNYDGKALTAYANAKGKKIKPVEKSLRPKLRGDKKSPTAATRAKEGSGKQHKRSKVFTAEGEAKRLQKEIADVAAKELANSKAFAAKVAAVRAEGNIKDGKTATVTPVTAMSEGASKAVDSSKTNTKGRPTNPAALKRYLAAQEGKNKGGMIMKKKKSGYAAGGMMAAKKKPAAKMMGGGMAAAKKKGSTMYNRGGAAKKR